MSTVFNPSTSVSIIAQGGTCGSAAFQSRTTLSPGPDTSDPPIYTWTDTNIPSPPAGAYTVCWCDASSGCATTAAYTFKVGTLVFVGK